MRIKNIKEQILKIKQENPSFGNGKIAKILKVSKSCIRYYLSPTFLSNNRKYIKNFRKNKPLSEKAIHFRGREILRKRKKLFNIILNNKTKSAGNKFKTKDLLNKIGENPKCYLTGRFINLNSPSSYNLDHIIPISKGGDNSLDNCNIACSLANRAKTDMTPEELFIFCKEILEYNGYIVTKKENGPIGGTCIHNPQIKSLVL